MQNCTIFCLGLLCLSLNLHAASYRTRNSGNWNTAQTWQVLNGSWTTATVPPGPNDEVIIQGGHAIQIILADASAQSVHIHPGATLRLASISLSLTINNGLPGADLIVEGTYQDDAGSGAGNGTFFNGGATWALGNNGTFIKTNNSSAARYRDYYQNGMSSIPASANWIIRYTGLGSPSFTTNNTFYPNLTFESVAGSWFPASGFSRFQGISATATIYGNLNIGGAGSGNVTIINENTFSVPLQVNGACIIKAGSTLTNMGNGTGTGFAIRGQLSISGNLLVSGAASFLRLNGFGTQSISGEGVISLSNLEVSNPNGVNLLRPLEVNYNLALSIGKIMLNAFDLTVNGTITGASSNAYIQTLGFGDTAGGLVRPVNGSVFFPVGNNSYNLAILTHNGGGNFKVRVEDVVLLNGEGSMPVFSNVVGRTWQIDGPVTNPMSLTLQWNASEQHPGFDPNGCYIAQNTGSGWSASMPGPAAGLGPYSRTRIGINQGGAFSVASGGFLPIELIYFKAQAFDKSVALAWQTAQEINFSHFDVERSADGYHFQKIGQVAGHGNTQVAHQYDFEDLSPLAGHNYYRLKQVDFDQTFEYSPIEVVRVENGGPVARLFPTVAQDQLTIEFAEPTSGELQIQDVNGQVFSHFFSTEHPRQHQLDIGELPPGLYLVLFYNKHQSQTLRFIKV